jgi:hypothetical protein
MPHTVRLEPPGRSVLELEGLAGAVSLAALLEALHRAGRRLPVHVAIYVGHELGRALRHLHEVTDEQGRPRELAHGAVHAGNVLLLRSGRVKLIDRNPPWTVGNRLADVHNLGLILWEMLVGWPLPDGHRSLAQAPSSRPSALRPDLSPEVDGVIRRALDRNPRRGYRSAGGLVSDTARFLSTRPDPRRGLRLLLNQLLDSGPHAGDAVPTRMTPAPVRPRAVPALPALPSAPSLPAWQPAPSQPAPEPSVVVHARALLTRAWLRRFGVRVLEMAIGMSVAIALLQAWTSFHPRGGPPAAPEASPHGTLIVPLPSSHQRP